MRDYFLGYFQGLKETLDKIDLGTLSKVNSLLFRTLENDQQIFTMGNGGSGSTASHIVGDLNKGLSFDGNKRFKAICLNDNIRTLLAYANDVAYDQVFVQPLRNFMKKGDIVIGFSGSGNSENVLQAVEYANQNDGITVGFSGFDGGKLAKHAQFPIIAPIHDMQKCEDVHLILCHMTMQTMGQWLISGKNGKRNLSSPAWTD